MAKGKGKSQVREGGSRLKVFNSGLEVWLYDDANLKAIRTSGGMEFGRKGADRKFAALVKAGTLVGYSLQQDDALDVAVYVGAPLTDAELSVARWLEPQRAFLRLPSGKLCVESNDASRIGPEKPCETGASVQIPAGAYRLTLYRIDREALDREGLSWNGAQEVLVLTPGGKPSDAAQDLLPFEPRRDTGWVGKYAIDGNKAQVLAWFSDYWDTFILNLDAKAAARLKLAPGSYLKTDVTDAGLSLVTVFAASWKEGERMPQPKGAKLEEYGYAALTPMGEWNGAEALFCRRLRAKKRAEDKHHNVWLPARVEVLDLQPEEKQKPGAHGFATTHLRDKEYFDSSFLGLILSDVLPEVADLDELSMADALERLDAKFRKLDFAPCRDITWEGRAHGEALEWSARLYTGQPDSFVAILAGEGRLVLLFLSELDDKSWAVTGLATDIEAQLENHPKIRLQSMDEELSRMFKAHQAALKKSKPRPAAAPRSADEAAAVFGRFLAVALQAS